VKPLGATGRRESKMAASKLEIGILKSQFVHKMATKIQRLNLICGIQLSCPTGLVATMNDRAGNPTVDYLKGRPVDLKYLPCTQDSKVISTATPMLLKSNIPTKLMAILCDQIGS